MPSGAPTIGDNTGDNGIVPPGRRALEQFLQDWIRQSPPALVAAARHAALSHSFDAPLLSFLRGTEEDTAALIARLEHAGLVSAVDPGRYAFDPALREIYLRMWQQENREAYRRASARAAEFYRSRRPLSAADQVTYVYHLLAADEPSGLEAFFRAWERAWASWRLGVAEHLLEIAREQVSVLGARTRAWLDLYGARLDLAYYRYERSRVALGPLVAVEGEPRLRAEALTTLGAVLVATRRWAEALERYEQAQYLFEQLQDRFGAARAHVAQGRAHLDLASSLGGLRTDASNLEPRALAWLHRATYLPFVVYRWLSRRIALLPRIYYGSDYQDWIIYRLLYQALHSLEEASGELARTPEEGTSAVTELQADVQILLADLYHRLGRWARASRLFQRLAVAAPVEADDYRRAVLHLAQGRAALARSAPREAIAHLGPAGDTFARYGDHRARATAARLLGDAWVARGDPGHAILSYAESMEASVLIRDLLAATHARATLLALQRRFRLSAAHQAQIDALAQGLDRRAYIVRFRGTLLRHFRHLATRLVTFLIVPLTYVVMSLMRVLAQIGLPVHVLLFTVVNLIAFGRAVPVKDAVTGAFFVLTVTLSMLWTYGFFYILLGRRFVRRLQIGDIARLQPEFLATFPEGITLRDQDEQLSEWQWDAMTRSVSANRAVWREPIALLSRTFLVSGAQPTIIDGTVRHYASLQQDIAQALARIGKGSVQRRCDFSFLRSRWTLIVLLLAAVIVAVTTFDWLDPTCRKANIATAAFIDSSEVYVCDEDGALQIVNVWDAADLKLKSSLPVDGQVRDVALSGHYAYLAGGDTGLHIVNVSDAFHPTPVAVLDTPGQASGVAVAGRYAYVADGVEGLRIIDIRNVGAPIEVRSHDTPGSASDVVVAGRFAYVVDGGAGLRIIDIRAPASPLEVGVYGGVEQVSGVAVRGRHAYIAGGKEGLRIVDVRNPAVPTEISALDTVGDASGIAVEGSVVYVAAGEAGLQVVDATRPSEPTVVASLDTPRRARSVDLTHGAAYVGDESGWLLAIAVWNPCREAEVVGRREGLGRITRVTARQASRLPITSLAFESLFWALPFLSIVGLCRLLYSRTALRQSLGRAPDRRIKLRQDWPILLALLALVAWTAFDVWTLTW